MKRSKVFAVVENEDEDEGGVEVGEVAVRNTDAGGIYNLCISPVTMQISATFSSSLVSLMSDAIAY